jgi:serine/threonine protein kinase
MTNKYKYDKYALKNTKIGGDPNTYINLSQVVNLIKTKGDFLDLDAKIDIINQKYNFNYAQKFVNNITNTIIRFIYPYIFLGKGSYGEVYKGVLYDNNSHTQKEIKKQKILNETCRELLSMINLRNNYIAQYIGYAINNKENTIFIFMEYVDGKTLNDYIREERNIISARNLEKIFAIINDLLNGIIILHSNNISHRDIKPENIMINDTNIKFIDFGFSCKKSFTCYLVNKCAGTLYYSSPQILTNMSSVMCRPINDEFDNFIKDDLWALGCSIYEVFFYLDLFLI